MSSPHDSVLDALLYPFAEGLLHWPQAAPVLFLRGREGAALHGLPHAALVATAQRWAETSTDLNLRIYQHSEALRISGLTFTELDSGHASRLSGIHPPEPE